MVAKALANLVFWTAVGLLLSGPATIIYEAFHFFRGNEWVSVPIKTVWAFLGGSFIDFGSYEANHAFWWLLQQPLSLFTSIVGGILFYFSFRHIE